MPEYLCRHVLRLSLGVSVRDSQQPILWLSGRKRVYLRSKERLFFELVRIDGHLFGSDIINRWWPDSGRLASYVVMFATGTAAEESIGSIPVDVVMLEVSTTFELCSINTILATSVKWVCAHSTSRRTLNSALL